MSKTLIITEKPSVAREYAAVLGVSGRGDGYFEGNGYVIAWCVGHLVTMSYPEKYDPDLAKWNMDDLPFIPEEFKYEVIDDVKDQYQVLKKWMNSPDIDEIYYGGDSGREGEYIGRLVRMLAGVRKGVREKRIWIDSFTAEEIKRGMREAKPLADYDSLSDAAYERAIEDYLTGINFSRALTCRFGNKYAAMIGKRKTLTVGRVMTCVLGMIVQREREIRNFKVDAFYRIAATARDIDFAWKAGEKSSVYNTPVLYNEEGFKTEDDAKRFIASLPGQTTVKSVETSTEKKAAPLLFNLAELQSECSKRFKISPAETLTIAQSLYEKKLTTYPRTDARFLSTAVAKEIDTNLKGLKKLNGDISRAADEALNLGQWKGIASSHYTNDSKIQDHFAIIPTGDVQMYDQLNDMEKNVYALICRRFISIFFPSSEYTKTVVELVAVHGNNEEEFKAQGKYLAVPGWMAVAGIPKADADGTNKQVVDKLNGFTKGEAVDTTYKTTKGETTPPKRYTSGSMVIAMENAGNLIEDEELRAQIKGAGIGTSATRAETISKLVKIGYIWLDGKTQVLTPLPAGEVLYDLVADVLPDLLSPKMTASWETGLEQVRSGKITKEKYQETVETYVRKGIDKIKATDDIKTGVKAAVDAANLKCPLCGKPVRRSKIGYGCTGWKKEGDGCNFTLWSKQFGKELTEAQMKQLLEKKKTGIIKGFQKKAGGTFDCALEMVVTGEGSNKKVEIKPVFEKRST